MSTALLKAVASIHSVPRRIVKLTVVTSWAVALICALQGWPLWAVALATLTPWVPVFSLEVVWTYRRFHWLALLYVLTVAQTGHLGEHVVQMVQLHVVRLPAEAAHGIISIFDSEWVHYGWNVSVMLVTLLLVAVFPRNLLLWLTTLVATWHGIEHNLILWEYVVHGWQGAPGLLGPGGPLRERLSLPLPATIDDLHFLYNVFVTAPLILAFILQVKRSHEERDRTLAYAAWTEARTQDRLMRLRTLRW